MCVRERTSGMLPDSSSERGYFPDRRKNCKKLFRPRRAPAYYHARDYAQEDYSRIFTCAIFPRVIVYRIRELAVKKGLTTAYQLQMAMNIPPNTASRWWRGEFKHIETETLERLCEFFDCKPGDIIVREKEEKRTTRSQPTKRAARS